MTRKEHIDQLELYARNQTRFDYFGNPVLINRVDINFPYCDGPQTTFFLSDGNKIIL